MIRVVVSVLILLSAPVVAGAETVHVSAAAQARAGIVLRPVQERTFGDQIRVLGQAVRSPGATTTVKSILEGRLEHLLVAPGDSVKRGQPLMELHSHMLHELQGALLRDSEALRLAETRLEAGRQLLEVEGISQVELDSRQHEALAARLAVSSGEAELRDLGYSDAELQRLLESTDLHPVLTLRAPTAGVILAVEVQQYAWVQAYDPLIVLGDPESLELELQLPPDEAAESDGAIWSSSYRWADPRPGAWPRSSPSPTGRCHDPHRHGACGDHPRQREPSPRCLCRGQSDPGCRVAGSIRSGERRDPHGRIRLRLCPSRCRNVRGATGGSGQIQRHSLRDSTRAWRWEKRWRSRVCSCSSRRCCGLRRDR